MTRAAILGLVAVVIGAASAGCKDPYAGSSRQPDVEPDTTPPHTSRPGPPARPPAPSAAQGAQSPRRAASSFAKRWVNWDWRGVADQQRALARHATGQLAQQLQANASSARIDATLARDKPGSRGAVAAIDLRTIAERATGIVVTREQTYTDGRADLGGRHYRVYRIGIKRDGTGWEVSEWEPQP
jgi:hypothetical protein